MHRESLPEMVGSFLLTCPRAGLQIPLALSLELIRSQFKKTMDKASNCWARFECILLEKPGM